MVHTSIRLFLNADFEYLFHLTICQLWLILSEKMDSMRFQKKFVWRSHFSKEIHFLVFFVKQKTFNFMKKDTWYFSMVLFCFANSKDSISWWKRNSPCSRNQYSLVPETVTDFQRFFLLCIRSSALNAWPKFKNKNTLQTALFRSLRTKRNN